MNRERLVSTISNLERVSVRVELEYRSYRWYLSRLVCTNYSENEELIDWNYGKVRFLRFFCSGNEFKSILDSIGNNGGSSISTLNLLDHVKRVIANIYGGDNVTHRLIPRHSQSNILVSDYPSDYFEIPLTTSESGYSDYDILAYAGLPIFPRKIDAAAYVLYGKELEIHQTIPKNSIIVFLRNTTTCLNEIIFRSGRKLEVTYNVEERTIAKNVELKVYAKRPTFCETLSVSESGTANFLFEEDPEFILLGLMVENELVDQRIIDFQSASKGMSKLPADVIIEQDQYDEIESLIRTGGEDVTTEFKKELPKDQNTLLKTIVAFANTQGGKIIIGVDDDGNIIGVDPKGVMEAITNALEDRVSGVIQPTFETYEIYGATVLVISVNEGINKPYGLRKSKSKSDTLVYYIRRFGSTRQAQPEDIRNICNSIGNDIPHMSSSLFAWK